jgi:hypothetical protein
MRNRRDFLSALGLSAGALALGIPATAFARERWRRRRCVPVCPAPSPCPCIEAGRAEHFGACVLACPQYVDYQANGLYYYYCNCCNIPNQHPIVPSNDPALPTTSCLQPDDNCFDMSNRCASPGPAPASSGGDAEFCYWARRRGSDDLATPVFRDGIKPASGVDLDRELRGHAPGFRVSEPYYVNYTWHSVDHTVALYDLDDPTGRVRGLGIGQEVVRPLKPNPDGTPPDVHTRADVRVSGGADFPHYHRLIKKAAPARAFHVATGK